MDRCPRCGSTNPNIALGPCRQAEQLGQPQPQPTPEIFAETHPMFRATGCLTRVYARVNPVTNVLWFSVFTDDGTGNGEHLFSVPMGALEQLIATRQQEDV